MSRNIEERCDMSFLPGKPVSISSRAAAVHAVKGAILLIFLAVLMVPPASASKASEETVAAFKNAIEAIKKVEHPLSGRGSAILEMYDRHPSIGASKKVVDFVFIGDMSRSTRFGIKEGKCDKPEVVWSVGKERAFIHNYRTDYAFIERNAALQFHYDHYNFNPRAFMEYRTPQPVDVCLQRVLDGPGTLSAATDSNGIAHLTADYRDPNVHTHLVISVDPAKGYRLVGGLSIMERFDRPDDSHTDFLEIQWNKYGSSWYVKAAAYTSYAGVHSPQDKSSLGPDNLRRSTLITVSDFDPNAVVSDSEFTLEGLELSPGTLVIDRVSGTTYKIE